MLYARRDLGDFSLSDDFVALSINLRHLMAVVSHLKYLTEHHILLALQLDIGRLVFQTEQAGQCKQPSHALSLISKRFYHSSRKKESDCSYCCLLNRSRLSFCRSPQACFATQPEKAWPGTKEQYTLER